MHEEPDDEEMLDPETRASPSFVLAAITHSYLRSPALTVKRRNLSNLIDSIIKKPKNTGGGRKKRGDNEDVRLSLLTFVKGLPNFSHFLALQDLEAMNDEAVVRLREAMFKAAHDDIDANENGRYAVNKLTLLPTVVEMMQKYVVRFISSGRTLTNLDPQKIPRGIVGRERCTFRRHEMA